MVAASRVINDQHNPELTSSASLSGAHPDGLILVAESDLFRRERLVAALHDAGYRVVETEDGIGALAQIAETPPALVIAAARLSGIDGLSFIEHLRAQPATRHVTTILLTDDVSAANLAAAFRRGVDNRLPESPDISELLAHVWVRLERPPSPRVPLPTDERASVLDERVFRKPLDRELKRAARTGRPGCLAYLAIAEMPRLRERLGEQVQVDLVGQVAELIARDGRATDLVGRLPGGRFAVLLPETDAEGARHRLDVLQRRVMGQTFSAAGEQLRLTPACGFAMFAKGLGPDAIGDQAFLALDHALDQLDLQPVRYDLREHGLRLPAGEPTWRARLWRHARVPVQLALA